LVFLISRIAGANDEPATASSGPPIGKSDAGAGVTHPGRHQPVVSGGVTHPAGRPSREQTARAARSPGHRHGEKQRKTDTRPERPARTKIPPAAPDGPCRPDEVTLQPEVSEHNEAGNAVELRLALQTTGRSACTLVLGPDNLLVKVTSADEEIWTTAQCPQAVIPGQQVIRAADPVTYRVVWPGFRSAPRCPPDTAAAKPGAYLVTAAVIGGEPGSTRFVLDPPRAPHRVHVAERGRVERRQHRAGN
jgi:hypothetical protein